jgi:hypothetical protein
MRINGTTKRIVTIELEDDEIVHMIDLARCYLHEFSEGERTLVGPKLLAENMERALNDDQTGALWVDIK